MLEKVPNPNTTPFMDFSTITRYSSGTGRCYVYNVVLKKTKQGKPFVTLYLRDIRGNGIPAYVFDLSSPLLAGKDAVQILNKIVQVDWDENYLNGVGLTLILSKVSVVNDATEADYALFQGVVEDINGKKAEIIKYISEVLQISVTLPLTIETYASAEYASGRQGGLLEHYWKMSKMLRNLEGLQREERRRLAGTFALYVVAHSSYISAKDKGGDDISLTVALTKRITSLSGSLVLGAAALEVVHMFFGYTPKDIYVRTVSAISDVVSRIDDEFSVYHTIPLEQEGDAGYGKIRRYQIEDT